MPDQSFSLTLTTVLVYVPSMALTTKQKTDLWVPYSFTLEVGDTRISILGTF